MQKAARKHDFRKHKRRKQRKRGLGKRTENILISGKNIRDLPNEIKLRIIRLAHYKQSSTALFATLFNGTKFEGVRDAHENAVTIYDVMKHRSLPHVPVSVTDLAKIIGRSSLPNKQRDLLMADPTQLPPVLHPEIELESGRFGSATSYEIEQSHILMAEDYSDLHSLGKLSRNEEVKVLRSLNDKISDDAFSSNPNDHASWAPSTSAVADALVVGLSSRLHALKSDPEPVIRDLVGRLEGRTARARLNAAGHWGPYVQVGVSAEGRLEVSRNLLMVMKSLKNTPHFQETILDAILRSLSHGTYAAHDGNWEKVATAIALAKALPDFAKGKGSSSKARIDNMAMTEFRSIVTGKREYSGEYRSRVDADFSNIERASIICESAASLSSQSSAIRNSELNPSVGKEISSFLDTSRAIVPWRSSIQTTMLNHMLEALDLGPKKKDPMMMNVFHAMENAVSWSGLLNVAPSLDDSSQTKIFNGFLKHLEKGSVLTDISQPQFLKANTAYREALGDQALLVNHMDQCRSQHTPSFNVLERIIPAIKDSKMAGKLTQALSEYRSLINEDNQASSNRTQS